MIRHITVSVLAIILVSFGGTSLGAEVVETAKSEGAGYYPQPYYFEPYIIHRDGHAGGHGGGHGGGIGAYGSIGLDLGTGILCVFGFFLTIVLFYALFQHLGKGHGDSGWGWNGRSAASYKYSSADIVDLSEKALQGIERFYKAYNEIA